LKTPFVFLALSIVLGTAMGCATVAQTPTDRAQIQLVLDQWKAAAESGDVDRLMSLYADDYNANGQTKADVAKDLASELKDSKSEGLVIIVNVATITIDGNKATAMPIAASSRVGSDSFRFDLAKEQGRWLIVGMANVPD